MRAAFFILQAQSAGHESSRCRKAGGWVLNKHVTCVANAAGASACASTAQQLLTRQAPS